MEVCFEITRDCGTLNKTTLLGNCFWRGKDSRNKSPLSAFDSADTVNEVERLLNSITGFFTIITPVETGWIIATDCIDSTPIYYTKTTSGLLVTDSQLIAEDRADDLTIDPVSVIEYRTATYVSGPYTLFESISQSEPGSYIHIKENDIVVERWFEFDYLDNQHRTVEDVHNITDVAISRLIRYADGRQIAIPLSGGHDSRLILTALVNAGYENLIAFSYGLPGNSDSKVSKKVAESLNVEWFYCEYTHEKWYDWYRTVDRQKLDNALWRVTVPPLREWAAVRVLLDDGVISNESIIVPGHSGMPMGGRLPESANQLELNSIRDIENRILRENYKKNSYTNEEKKQIRKRIRGVIQYEKEDFKKSLAAIERFDYRERQAKQITAHVWAEDFLGVDWWMPLLDIDFVEFWLCTDMNQRIGKNYYRHVVDQMYRNVAEDPVERDASTPETLWDKIKRIGHNSMFRPVLAKLYFGVRNQRPELVYKSPPTGRLGVMSFEQFKEVFDGQGHLRAYRARAILGEFDIAEEPKLTSNSRDLPNSMPERINSDEND